MRMPGGGEEARESGAFSRLRKHHDAVSQGDLCWVVQGIHSAHDLCILKEFRSYFCREWESSNILELKMTQSDLCFRKVTLLVT